MSRLFYARRKLQRALADIAPRSSAQGLSEDEQAEELRIAGRDVNNEGQI